MKTKIISAAVLFALLVIGTALVVVPKEAAAKEVAETTVYTVDSNPYISPSTDAGCTRVCSWCVIYGHNGACTTSGSCC
ncbi:MAG: hypothetical protein ACP5N2_04085 [Candidatus Nanoarchaeia archaeon]